MNEKSQEEKEDLKPTGEKWFKVYYMGRPIDTIPALNIDDAVQYLNHRKTKYSKVVPI